MKPRFIEIYLKINFAKLDRYLACLEILIRSLNHQFTRYAREILE